ncbi:DUF3617 domain-containing protein [Pseudoduganella violaceinigra]|uniref:DUF3617 domain-containing protein n=1 Tax=Pseudoduganella violaceinigra TaxID=246602 RepID=UPI0003FB8A53|nr:DUF3617 domain-containing protein [Pseudoduganella violaceinigra]
MKFCIKDLALGASLAAICLSSQAEIIPLKLAPGLWEETRVTLINGQNVDEAIRKSQEKMMARLTPEQRKEMQEQMGNRGAGGTVQTCLTPAQVAKGIDTDRIKRKMEESARGCKLDIISASSSGAKFNASCMGPQGGGYKGIGEYMVPSTKEWRFKMVGDGKMTGPNGAPAQGGDVHASQEVTARWKGSDCGNVPPRLEE